MLLGLQWLYSDWRHLDILLSRMWLICSYFLLSFLSLFTSVSCLPEVQTLLFLVSSVYAWRRIFWSHWHLKEILFVYFSKPMYFAVLFHNSMSEFIFPSFLTTLLSISHHLSSNRFPCFGQYITIKCFLYHSVALYWIKCSNISSFVAVSFFHSLV